MAETKRALAARVVECALCEHIAYLRREPEAFTRENAGRMVMAITDAAIAACEAWDRDLRLADVSALGKSIDAMIGAGLADDVDEAAR